MYVPLLYYHNDLFILMWSLFLRVWFLEVPFDMVMWRWFHTPTKYVCGASLCDGVLEQERADQVQDKLWTIGLSMPGKREASGRRWFNVGRVV